jgi:MSHA biogenesis protein MshQ
MLFKVITLVFTFILFISSVQAATTYDFASRNAGINAFAYEGISSSALPAVNTFPSDQHSNSEYSNISINNGLLNTISTSQNNNYPMIRYVFELDEAEANINQLDFFWNGSGVNNNGGKDDGVVLYLWNYTNGNYDQIVTSGDTASEVNLTHTLTANIIDYIDENNNNTLTMLVVSNDKTNGNSSNEIRSDYVSIEVDATSPVLACNEPGYTQVYSLAIDTTNLHNNVPYSLNNSSLIADGSFDRIAYQVELQKPGETSECVWVSMDTFTQDAALIGVPSFAGSNTSFQQTLTNMNVLSNKVGIVTGVGITTGNIEFWPYNYSTTNVRGVPSASGSSYDTGDSSSNSSSYGSMQVHNHGANQTLFALNRFSGRTNKDLGIGDNQASRHTDWTFAGNSGQYSVKNLNIYVSLKEVISKPVVDYRFDECSYTGLGSDVIDQISNTNASSNGLFSPVDNGIINKSLDLSANNTSDWIDVPSSAVNGLDDFSVSVWFKTSVNKSQQEIFHALGDSSSDDELEIYLKDNFSVILKLKDNSQELVSNIELTNGNWHHLLITRVNENACLYIDGAEQQCVTSVNVGPLLVDSPNAIVIGQEQDSFGGTFSTSQNFVGQLDEFKIFNLRLSESEIESVYRNESAGNNYDGSSRDATRCDNSCGLIPGELNAVGIRIGSGGNNTQINTTTEALAIHAAWLSAGSPASGLIEGGTYNVVASGASQVDRIDFGGSEHDFSGTLSYPGVSAGVGGEDFLVHTSGTISLLAGSYTIYVEADDGFSFTMDTLSGDTVLFNKFGSSRSGASNELRFENPTGNSNTGGYFTLDEDSVFDIATIFFERGGGDYLEISISNDIRTNAAPSGYEILRDGALNGKVQLGECAASVQVNHYQIIHDGQGLTCDAETITINACTNAYDGSCTLSDALVTLDVKATGSSSVTDSISFTGTGTASIPYTLAESTILSIQNASIEASNPLVCINGSTTSCNLLFTDAGFRFLNGSSGSSEVITNQIAGTSFPLRIEAVENNNGVCEGLFTDNKNINLSQENVSPSGNDGLSFSINGNDIAKYRSVTSTTLNFETDSIATFPTPIYHDAGQIRLHASYDIGGVSLTGSSNSFWVSPAELVLNAKSGAVNLDGATATTNTTFTAGDNFDLTVTAFNSLGVITPNYSPGQIQLKLSRIGPINTDSVDGYFSYAAMNTLTSAEIAGFQNISLTNFSSGVSAYNAAQYSEVGLLNLDVQDSNYGNANIVIAATAINIGRFIPDHFKQTVAREGSFLATCNTGTTFAYSGQKDEATNSVGAISYLTNPVLAITAFNKQGEITQNYSDSYMNLSNTSVVITAPSLDQVAIGFDANPLNKLPLTANMNTGTLSQNDLTTLVPTNNPLPKGVLHYQFSGNDNFFYNRSANALVAPFTSDIDFSTATITDTDGVNVTTTVDVSPTGIDIRFGRLVLENSFGSETSNVNQPMQIQHFDGTSFVVTSNNDCVNYDATNISLSNISLDPALTNVLGGSGNFVSGKTQGISLQAPGAGNQGQIGVLYSTYDWLKYDWDNDGAYDDNPTAISTFGIFRGNDRIISWREVGN